MNNKQRFYRWVNKGLAKLGYRIERAPVFEQERYFVSDRHTVRLCNALTDTALAFFKGHPQFLGEVDRAKLRTITDDFVALFPKHPVRITKGGNNFNSCYWLYLVTRLRDPDVIIESGSFRGQSAWIFRQAAPDAKLYCFDIETGRFELDDPAIELVAHDWSEYDFSDVDLSGALCFFDDHVSHARRVRECHDLGMDLVIFDDDVPALHLPTAAEPSAPTLNMIYDDTIEDNEEFVWSIAGQHYKRLFSRPEAVATRALIASYQTLPQLLTITGFQRQSGLSLVKLTPLNKDTHN